MSEDLMSKVTELQNELNSYKSAYEGIMAQLEAHKQMLNESLNINLQLRTGNIMLQKQLKDALEKAAALQKEVEELKKPVEEPKEKPKSKK